MTDNQQRLTGSRVVLRAWCDADLQPFARMNADPTVMAHFPKTLTVDESNQLAAKIRAQMAERGFGLWAVELPGVAPFIGFVGLSVPQFEAHFTPCVEVGWRLAAKFWNNGYATEAARLAVDFGFSELGLEEIVSLTATENRASQRVMQKLGMTCDRADDFDHPRVPAGHRLQRHVLYRLKPYRLKPS